jgi:hypothetical protein
MLVHRDPCPRVSRLRPGFPGALLPEYGGWGCLPVNFFQEREGAGETSRLTRFVATLLYAGRLSLPKDPIRISHGNRVRTLPSP